MLVGWLVGWLVVPGVEPSGVWLDRRIADSLRQVIDHFDKHLAIIGKILDQLGDAVRGFMAVNPMSCGVAAPKINFGHGITIANSEVHEVSMVATEAAAKVEIIGCGECLMERQLVGSGWFCSCHGLGSGWFCQPSAADEMNLPESAQIVKKKFNKIKNPCVYAGSRGKNP